MKKILQFSTILIILLSCRTGNFTSSDILVNAIINEKWEDALLLCDNQYKDSTSVVYRALKGHVFLAGNRNNESLDMFLSINNPEDKQSWFSWIQEKQGEIKQNPVMIYLYGDAYARLEKWDNSIENYNSALTLRQSNLTKAMNLNALGVSRVYKNELDEALGIVEKAAETYQEFADAYASMGTINILKRKANGASDDFQKALSISNDFALAYNGKGCALYGRFTEDSLKLGMQHFTISANNEATKKLAISNLLGIFNITSIYITDSLFRDSAGTSLTTFGTQGSLDTWSDGQLKSAVDHNYKSSNILGAIAGDRSKQSAEFGVNVGVLSAKVGSEVESASWGKKAYDKNQSNLKAQLDELKSRGIDYKSKNGPGGVATEEMIKDALVDDGNWKVKNWFGLAFKNE